MLLALLEKLRFQKTAEVVILYNTDTPSSEKNASVIKTGKALSHLLEAEVSSLLNDQNSLLADYLNDKEWLC